MGEFGHWGVTVMGTEKRQARLRWDQRELGWNHWGWGQNIYTCYSNFLTLSDYTTMWKMLWMFREGNDKPCLDELEETARSMAWYLRCNCTEIRSPPPGDLQYLGVWERTNGALWAVFYCVKKIGINCLFPDIRLQGYNRATPGRHTSYLRINLNWQLYIIFC